MSATHNVTELLARWADGDKNAPPKLTPIVNRELRLIAASYLRKERRDHTLQPTALVNEAYLRLIDDKQPNWQKVREWAAA